MGLQYQVTRDGQVVNMTKIDDDGQDIPYQVSVRTSAELPWKNRQITRFSRWMPLKRAVLAQETNVWYVYAGFGEVKELKQARSAFAKYKSDVTLKTRLNGHGLILSTNAETLEIAIKKVEPEAVRVDINELQAQPEGQIA